MNDSVLDTEQKALELNMDQSAYGTFAEIGAGQETARWFFNVGGAAGTVAKAMSAYDMTYSDSIYGECSRYVSRERLNAMLGTEYDLLHERLGESRGDESKFFAFANTVATFSFTKQCAGHGWLGIRFQSQPNEEMSQIDLHVALKGQSAAQDQRALGILGVNLIYGSYYLHDKPIELLVSLIDNLRADQLEIDMIDFEGPVFKEVDNRLMALQLVQHGLTHSAMFQSDGKVVQPSDVLYKKAVLVERSRFRPPTHLNMNMLDCAYDEFCKELGDECEDVIVLSEMTLQNLKDGDDINVEDFLQRIEILCALGKNVMISNYDTFYRLAQYLFRMTSKPVAIALGVPTLKEIFNEKHYEHLEGGILEAFGKLFRDDMRMYVCPAKENGGELTTVHEMQVQNHMQHLYDHLLGNGCIRSLDTVNNEYLAIHADTVLDKIRSGDSGWQKMVPDTVVKIISDNGLFRQ